MKNSIKSAVPAEFISFLAFGMSEEPESDKRDLLIRLIKLYSK